MPESVQLICHEDAPERLLADLADYRLDVVISDVSLSAVVRVKAYSHPIGSCPVSLFAAPALARTVRRDFPASLTGTPFLMPMAGSSLRRWLDRWFDALNLRPKVVGEFKGSALMKAFGEPGIGIFATPHAVREEISRHYSVVRISVIGAIVERFYAISVERKIKHPAVLQITEAANGELFAPSAHIRKTG